MTNTKFIQLSQACKIKSYDENEFGGLKTETVYESVFISAAHIVSMFSAGTTRLKLSTGEDISVRETPAEIIGMLAGQPARKGGE